MSLARGRDVPDQGLEDRVSELAREIAKSWTDGTATIAVRTDGPT